MNRNKPILCAIGGFIGTGKTTLAYALRKDVAALEDASVFEGDQTRRQLLGYGLSHVMSEADYAADVSQKVRDHIDKMTVQSLVKGKSVIDASGFWSNESQNNIEKLAQQYSTSFVGLWLSAPIETLEQRVKKRLQERSQGIELSVEKGHASDACLAVFDKCNATIETPTSNHWHFLDAEQGEDVVLKQARAFIV